MSLNQSEKFQKTNEESVKTLHKASFLWNDYTRGLEVDLCRENINCFPFVSGDNNAIRSPVLR